MATKQQPKNYEYVRICVKNASGKYSTISIQPKRHDLLLKFARGSFSSSAPRVTDVCRESANDLHNAKYTGKLSIAVYERALSKLRGAFDKDRAAAYDAAQLPDGVAV